MTKYVLDLQRLELGYLDNALNNNCFPQVYDREALADAVDVDVWGGQRSYFPSLSLSIFTLPLPLPLPPFKWPPSQHMSKLIPTKNLQQQQQQQQQRQQQTKTKDTNTIQNKQQTGGSPLSWGTGSDKLKECGCNDLVVGGGVWFGVVVSKNVVVVRLLWWWNMDRSSGGGRVGKQRCG